MTEVRTTAKPGTGATSTSTTLAAAASAEKDDDSVEAKRALSNVLEEMGAQSASLRDIVERVNHQLLADNGRVGSRSFWICIEQGYSMSDVYSAIARMTQNSDEIRPSPGSDCQKRRWVRVLTQGAGVKVRLHVATAVERTADWRSKRRNIS